MIVNLIERIYGFLWGDLLQIPLPGGGSVALLSAAFQTYLVQGRKCGLGGGEECGKRDQNDQRHQERYTAIVHNKG